jgi:diaminopimelate decarboxylase
MMTTVERAGQLCVEQVPLEEIAARFGTPCYVYSKAAIVDAFSQYRTAFGDRDHLVLYAVKANSNIAILKLLAGLGSGFDIVSGGELARVLAAGAEPSKIVFSGVGKSTDEIQCRVRAGARAAVRTGTRHRCHCQRQPASKSGRRCEDSSLHLDRAEAGQVRRAARFGTRPVPQGASASGSARHRHRLPHRLPADRYRPLRRSA